MAKRQTNSKSVRITRDLLAKVLTWHCPRYTRQGGHGAPPHSCDNFDGTYDCCKGPSQLCSQVLDIFKTMAKIQNGEIDVM